MTTMELNRLLRKQSGCVCIIEKLTIMRRMINGEREECSMQMKLYSPNGMGDTQLNRKNREGKTTRLVLVTNCCRFMVHNF